MKDKETDKNEPELHALAMVPAIVNNDSEGKGC